MPADPPPQPVQPIGPQPQPPQGPVPTPEPIQRPSVWRTATACTALVLMAACRVAPDTADRSTPPAGASAPGQGSVMGGPPSREDDCRGPAHLCKQDSAR